MVSLNTLRLWAQLKKIRHFLKKKKYLCNYCKLIINCLEQIRLPISLHMCIMYSELPSNISFVVKSVANNLILTEIFAVFIERLSVIRILSLTLLWAQSVLYLFDELVVNARSLILYVYLAGLQIRIRIICSDPVRTLWYGLKRTVEDVMNIFFSQF